MKFLQALQEEDTRFEEEQKRAQERHKLAQNAAKKDVLRRMIEFSERYYIGEWTPTITETPDNSSVRYDKPFWKNEKKVGRYFTVNGEPTTFYLVRTDELRISHPDYIRNWSHAGVCIDEDSPDNILKVIQFLKWGNHPMALSTGGHMYGASDSNIIKPIFSFSRRTTQESTMYGYLCYEEHKSGSLCDIDIVELGMAHAVFGTLSPFEILIANLVREQSAVKSEEEVREEVRRKLNN